MTAAVTALLARKIKEKHDISQVGVVIYGRTKIGSTGRAMEDPPMEFLD